MGVLLFTYEILVKGLRRFLLLSFFYGMDVNTH